MIPRVHLHAVTAASIPHHPHMPAWQRQVIVAAVVVAALLLATAAMAQSSGGKTATAALIERGRYVVTIAGCNDCHTPGYAVSGGQVPEQHWLTGDRLGWRGPWGTTYPVNLRHYMQQISEAEWLEVSGSKVSRPPMPWFTLQRMSRQDRRAVYHFIRTLGPAGPPAPDFVPPEREPVGPVVRFPEPPPQR